LGISKIVSLNQESIQNLNAIATYEVPSDDITRVKIFVDGIEVDEITQDFEAITEYQYTVTELSEGSFEFGVQSFDDDNDLSTPISKRQGSIIGFNASQRTVVIGEFEAQDVSLLDGSFLINNLEGAISNTALNNEDHPYSDSRTYTSYIKTPVTIGATDNILIYEDFAITEADFDFVFIEGSIDLSNWITLDTYSSTKFPEWLAQDDIAVEGGTPTITDDLFKTQQIDLTSLFSENDEVAIRLRLVTDNSVTSYGWAIKSFKFNEPNLSVSDPNTGVYNFRVYPTVSQGDINIYASASARNSTVNIYDINGKEVFKTNIDFAKQETNQVKLNLSAGVYILQVLDANSIKSFQKIIIQ
jgi:hypothetical protein